MNLRFFAAAAIILGGAAGLQAVNVGGGLAALIAAPALAAGHEDAPHETEEAHDAAPGALPTPESGASGPSFSEKIGASADEYRILISLQQRREELEQWSAQIDTRAQLVESAEARVAERLAELHNVRAEIEGLLGVLEGQEETRIASLVSTYEKMKSKDAARILAGLDNDTALLVLSRMKAASLSTVLGDMETPDAMRITGLLAARADTRAIVGEMGTDAEDAAPATLSAIDPAADAAPSGET